MRARSFIWPWGQCALGLGVVVLLAGLARPGGAPRPRHAAGAGASSGPGAGGWARWAVAAVLLACETAFLVSAGASLWSSSPRPLTPTPAEVTLMRTVGAGVVGLGSDTCFTPDQLGTVPDVNAAFGLHEFAAYDPLLPHRYDTAWFDQTGQPPLLHHGSGAVPFSVFCPVVPSARIARRYGIGFVLEHPGTPGPAGTVLVRRIAGEDLYRVPGAAAATEVPMAVTGVRPGLDAPGAPVAVTHPDPATWRVATHAAAPVLLRLRLTDVPGWHATIDGRPAALQAFAGVMLQVQVPAGTHVVDVRYRPAAFSAGVAAAVVAALGLVAVPGGVRLRSRRRARRAVSGPG